MRSLILNRDRKNREIGQNNGIIDSLISLMGATATDPLDNEMMEGILWIKTLYMIPRGISGLCELCCRQDNGGYISVGQSMDILTWYSILSRPLLVDAIAMFLSKSRAYPVAFSESERSLLLQEETLPPYEKKKIAECDTEFNLAITYLHLFDTLRVLLKEAVTKKTVLIVC